MKKKKQKKKLNNKGFDLHSFLHPSTGFAFSSNFGKEEFESVNVVNPNQRLK